MQFISVPFLIFLFLSFFIYFGIKKEYRYLILLVANYVFFGWNNLYSVPALLLATVLTYIGGLVLQKKKSKAIYAVFFSLSLFILVFFKYSNFLIDNINVFFAWLGKSPALNKLDILTPLGLSFFLFQSTGYLNDVYRKDMPAERNFFRYAAFVSFFPTVVSGPIQQSRKLLPQLKEPVDFDFENARKGVYLLAWGFFQKMVICPAFAKISNLVFDAYTQYDNVYYLIAAVCYSFYIYCDFSSYSDMACGIARIFGFQVSPNFKNPYLSQSIGEFWNRWHMSLNTWFVENVYIPLGGSRKGRIRKYVNIFLVFFFSGIWHGASWSFVVWGILNGVLRILEEISSPLGERFLHVCKLSPKNPAVRFIRRGVVFGLITVTWVFFRMPSVSAALHIVKNMLFFYPSSLWNSNISSLLGTRVDVLFFGVVLLVFALVQYARKGEGKLYSTLQKMPSFWRILGCALLIAICVIVACSGTATFNTQFIYFQF